MTIHQRLAEAQERLDGITLTIRQLTKSKLELQDKVDKLKKTIKNSITVEQEASKMLQGHSKETLRKIWNEYLYVRTGFNIAGRIIVDDLEGAQADDILFHTVLKEVGGNLLTEAFGHLLEFKLDENGNKLYPSTISGTFKIAKDRFNRRIRRTPIIDAFRPYATLVKMASKQEMA